MLGYDFVIKALIVGVCISLCSSLLGVNMVLKNKSMIGDGLSHVAFGACAIAASLNWAPLLVSIIVVVIAAFIILKLSEKSKIQGDSMIALFASSSLAIGYIVIKMGGLNKDLDSYLYGNIYMISTTELILTLVLTVVVIGSFIIFYNRIFTITFDEDFSKSSGVKTEIYNIIISILCAFTVVIGMKVMGTLLITSLIVFPVLSARQICRTYKHVVIASAIIAVICFIIGIVINLGVDLPVGATIVVVNLIVFIVLLLFGKIIRRNHN
jgi:zinc transport system permease protein